MFSLFTKFPMLLDADPLGKFGDGVNYVMNISKKVGPPMAAIALIITLCCIFFAGEKKTLPYIRKAILICIGVAIILNIGYVVGFFDWMVKQLFTGGTDYQF